MDVNTATQAYMSYIQPFASKDKLGATAVTNGVGSMGLTYLSSFISNCSSCTIDFVNIHWYDSATNTASFKAHVEQAYTAGGNRPLWITEFAVTETEDE
jgi:Glycosyl hydrolase catalytic core